MVYDQKQLPLAQWLQEKRPSIIKSSDAEWIFVSSPMYEEQQVIREIINWEPLLQNHEVVVPNEIALQIDELAQVSQCLSGKWLIYCQSANIDLIWSRIAADVFEGNLGTCCKVSPGGLESKQLGSLQRESHVICVYTQNYQDQMDVFRVRNRLREFHGIDRPIGYKVSTALKTG